jgi:glycosyltransferase involved in cell wall biosynthesis
VYTLSIILNLHREGHLAEKTIRNLETIINTKSSWEKVEIIAVLDNADESTKKIVYSHKKLFNIIDEVDFRDLAHSRNHGVSRATQNFILFADGDDYFSYTILPSLYKSFHDYYSHIVHTNDELKHLLDTQHIVVFPHYYVEFPALLQAEYFDSTDYTVQNNKFLHCFGSRIAVFKDILTKYPVHENKSPYGYEDWDLNNRLLANGLQYKIADFTLYYRRENSQSLLAMQIKNKNIVRNSELYNFSRINNTLEENKNRDTAIIENIPQPVRGKLWRTLAKSKILKKIYHVAKSKLRKPSIINKSLFQDDIVFLKAYGETVSAREDIQTYSLQYYASHLSIQAKTYSKLMQFLSQKEVVYFFPWIVVGGADKVSVEYTKALHTKNCCVITSIESGVRINDIKVPHLDLISDFAGWQSVTEEDQLHILIKALINSNVKLVHIVNSEIAIKTVKYYKEVYNQYNIKTIVSLFCPEYHWVNHEWHGYPVMYPELFNNADLVLLDNHYWYTFFKDLNHGVDYNYKKLASPTEKQDISYSLKTDNTNKILWASRICNQKLFGVFEEIVNLSPQYTFIIYGSVDEHDEKNKKILNRLLKKENVEFRGVYRHISEINLNEFDLYLFTSLYEGIPTIILDMVMGGIPIVSAKVGGISEVLGEDYPLLVHQPSDATEYVSKIKAFYDDKNTIVQMMPTVQNTVLEEYNFSTFESEYNTCIKELMA